MAGKRSALGNKGMAAFFGADVVREVTEEAEEKKNKSKKADKESAESVDNQVSEEPKETFLKMSLVEPNREQPRKVFNEEQLRELADSISQYGVLQPIIVQKRDNYYEIIAGERRWRAAKLAGLKEVPVVIREYTKQVSMEIALIENVQREDLNPIEEARAYQALMQEFGLKQEEIADKVSKNRATVTNSMRLLKLDQKVQNMLIEGSISSGHARALLGLSEPEKQIFLAEKIVSEKLSVREVEKAVKILEKPIEKKTRVKEEESEAVRLAFLQLEDRMKSIMGTKVSINKKDKSKGRIEIEYYSPAELERLVELIETICQ